MTPNQQADRLPGKRELIGVDHAKGKSVSSAVLVEAVTNAMFVALWQNVPTPKRVLKAVKARQPSPRGKGKRAAAAKRRRAGR